MLDVTWLIPALPLAGFALLLLFGKRLGEPWSGWLAPAACFTAFVATVVVFGGLLNRSGDNRQFDQHLFTWFKAGSLKGEGGLLADQLSITMALFVTGVGALIHLYSIGYMHGDERYPKFFLYLNLFVFSMLMLVLGDS